MIRPIEIGEKAADLIKATGRLTLQKLLASVGQ